ncbi:14514_t:CDS:1, partial [Racocetra fulgida]
LLSPIPNHEAGPGPATQAYRERVQKKEYAPEENFQSICEIENGIVEKEPPSEEIKFLKKRPDTERLYKSLDA